MCTITPAVLMSSQHDRYREKSVVIAATCKDRYALAPLTKKRPIRVLVATGSLLLRKALRALIKEHEDLHLCGVSARTDSLQKTLAETKPDVLLIDDICAALLSRLDERVWNARVFIASHRPHPGIKPGFNTDLICGFFGSQGSEVTMREALQKITNCATIRRRESPACNSCPLIKSLLPAPLPLSPREQQVFEHIGKGLGNQEIAGALGCAVKTIEVHRENIKGKLGLSSGIALTGSAMAWARGQLMYEDI